MDEAFVTLRGEPYLLWQAVDQYGAELDILLVWNAEEAIAEAAALARGAPSTQSC
jgi:putative transposase